MAVLPSLHLTDEVALAIISRLHAPGNEHDDRTTTAGLPILLVGSRQSRSLRVPIVGSEYQDGHVTLTNCRKTSRLRTVRAGAKILRPNDLMTERPNGPAGRIPQVLKPTDQRTHEDLHDPIIPGLCDTVRGRARRNTATGRASVPNSAPHAAL